MKKIIKNLLNTKIIFKNFVKYFEISYNKSLDLYHKNYLKINLTNLKINNNFYKNEKCFKIKADFIIILHYRKFIAKQFYEGIKLFYYKI